MSINYAHEDIKNMIKGIFKEHEIDSLMTMKKDMRDLYVYHRLGIIGNNGKHKNGDGRKGLNDLNLVFIGYMIIDTYNKIND